VAPRNPFFDLPPWGVALCLLAAACLIGVAVLPGLYTDLARNETAGGEPLQAPLPGREGETQLSYDPGLERMTVACFPGPATTALTLKAHLNGCGEDPAGNIPFYPETITLRRARGESEEEPGGRGRLGETPRPRGMCRI
jgi:hypothetical protein